MPEIFAYLPIFSYLCRSNRDATATSALRSPSTTLYLIISPIYLPLKHTITNKTWKTILKILGYVISFLLTKDKGQKTKKQFV